MGCGGGLSDIRHFLFSVPEAAGSIPQPAV